MTLRTETDHWQRDLRQVGDRLHELGLPEQEGAQSLPGSLEKQRLAGVTEEELAAALQNPDLHSWEPWEEVRPNEYPLTRQELRRVFEFERFSEAIEFMNFMAPRFDAANHHPRWANEWRRVTIRLTTWAAGNRITDVDIRVARQIEQWHREFRMSLAVSGARTSILSSTDTSGPA
jgi:pterin-4a-carbinolamine dehydratase